MNSNEKKELMETFLKLQALIDKALVLLDEMKEQRKLAEPISRPDWAH
jgi:hypothetical protein